MFAYLYNKELRIDPKQPKKADRDRFVLSKGHTAPGLYSALAYRGFFPVSDLPTLRHADSYLQGHPNMNLVPGVDMSTGSLGRAFPVRRAWPRARNIWDRISTCIPCWAMAKSRKAKSGKHHVRRAL